MGDVPYLFLANFEVTIYDFASMDEGYAWVHNAQLQRLALYFLLHGEAANLRHTPECLYYIFYGMAHALVLVDTRVLIEPTGIDFPEVTMLLPEHRPPRPGFPGGRDPYLKEDYLNRIVEPIYGFIAHEVSARRLERLTGHRSEPRRGRLCRRSPSVPTTRSLRVSCMTTSRNASGRFVAHLTCT